MDWQVGVQAGILLIAMLAFYLTSSARYVTIREHAEFRDALLKTIVDLQKGEEERIRTADVRRELDQILERIRLIEQTRPTTGELEARFYRNSNGQKVV